MTEEYVMGNCGKCGYLCDNVRRFWDGRHLRHRCPECDGRVSAVSIQPEPEKLPPMPAKRPTGYGRRERGRLQPSEWLRTKLTSPL